MRAFSGRLWYDEVTRTQRYGMMESIVEPSREIPIVDSADVVVVGGGPGGIIAAVASARSGAETVLIERNGFLGGTATAGLMTCFNGFRNERPPNHVQTVRGIVQELVDRLSEAGGACGCTAHGNFGELSRGESPYAVSIDPEVLKHVALELMAEAGVRPMLHSLFCSVIRNEREVDAIVLETKSGRVAVRGKLYVDASGDGDVAARAGARFEKARTSGERMMPLSLMYRVIGVPRPGPDDKRLWINGVTTRWGPGVSDCDGTVADDLTCAELRGRMEVDERIRELREEFPTAQLIETAPAIGVRETRRVLGLYTITEEDVLSGRAQPDAVAVSSNPVPTYYGERRFLDHLGFEIPYRSLVPADIDNLLLAGRCISAGQPAFQSARSMAPAMAVSQASGTAAAMCALSGLSPAKLPYAKLRKKLEDDNAVVCIPQNERSLSV